jgi:hypothetical protein
MAIDWKNGAIDAGIVTVVGGLSVKYLVPKLTSLPVVGDFISMIPVDFQGIPVHVLIFGGLGLIAYRTYMK